MKKLFVALFLAALMVVPQTVSAQWSFGRLGRGHGGWYGGGYDSWYGYAYQCGIKFDLDLVLESGERKLVKLVKNGSVRVDGNEFAIVNRHDGFWNGILPLPPGPHSVEITLEDGRVFATQVSLMPGYVVHVYPRFRPRSEFPVVAAPSATPVVPAPAAIVAPPPAAPTPTQQPAAVPPPAAPDTGVAPENASLFVGRFGRFGRKR